MEPSSERVSARLKSWLAEHEPELAVYRELPYGSMEIAIEHHRPFQQLLYDDGWTRLGWPRWVGGRGGAPTLRLALYDALADAHLVFPPTFEFLEIVVPTLVRFAPELAMRHFGSVVRGDEVMCQGFSEPEAGSDLASLTTSATMDGSSYRLTGSKIWSTHGHLADWGLILARTGQSGSRHRGLSMFWVPMDSAGVTARGIDCADGRDELAELFLDDVVVPASNMVGALNGGWGVAMFLLQYERSFYAWQRQAAMRAAVEKCLADADEASMADIGEAYMAIMSLRARSLNTTTMLAAGEFAGPQTSADKLLLGDAERRSQEAIRSARCDSFDIGADRAERSGWLHSRVSSILGGAAEIRARHLGRSGAQTAEGAHMSERDDIAAAMHGLLDEFEPDALADAFLEAGLCDLFADPMLERGALLTMFQVHGERNAVSPLLDLVAQWFLGLDPVASAVVVFPGTGRRDAPTGLAVDGRVEIDGIVLGGWSHARTMLVPTRGADRVSRLLRIDPAEIEIDGGGGLDPSLGWGRVHGVVVDVVDAEPVPWHTAAMACQLALAAELLGSAVDTHRRTLEHVVARKQFDASLATHQTVRHRLADVHVAICAADALLSDVPANPAAIDARAAKAVAAKAGIGAADTALQLSGAMGYTAGHFAGERVVRCRVLDSMLGSAKWASEAIGASLAKAGRFPERC